MQLEEFLRAALPPEDGRTKISPVKALLVLLRNLLVAREPIYGVGEWAARQAYIALYAVLDQQAHLWAFVDNFFLFGALALAGLPLIFLFKRVQYLKKPAAK